MSDAMTFVELDGLHVELLPARTVLSLLKVVAPGATGDPTPCQCPNWPSHDVPCCIPLGEGPPPTPTR
jgi:hypothetical protein